jgi:hypothetical protein
MKQFVIQNQEVIDEQVVKDRLMDHDEVKIQFSKPVYTQKTLEQIDELASVCGPNLLVRFYDDGFDCDNFQKIPHVKALSIDCVQRVKNIHKLKDLNCLTKIGIGISELEDMELLAFDNLKKVDRLSILDTKSKAFNLEHLKDYSNLVHLQVGGHTKNINALSNLKRLKTLSLNSVSKVPLAFVNHLQSLETLRIILGGRANINEIEENNIKHLVIDWVKGFNDLSAIKNFKYLETLRVEYEIQLKEIEFPVLDFLEDIKILNCKSLMSIKGLENLKSLNGLRLSTPAITFEEFITCKFPAKLKVLAFYTWKSKQDKLNRAVLDNMGFNEF